jgi:hypothetical protein
MTATLVSPEDLLAVRQTLQEITESAICDREERPLVAAEMLVPVVQLAQQITEQLQAYGLASENVRVGEGESSRLYCMCEVSWKTGRFGARTKHGAVVLYRALSVWERSLMWDPRTPNATWDLEHPPQVKLEGLDSGNFWQKDHLATAIELAQWAKDAQSFLTIIRTRESERTAHLRDGLSAGEAMLAELAL